MIMAESEELEAIRARRLAELQAEHGGVSMGGVCFGGHNEAKIVSVG